MKKTKRKFKAVSKSTPEKDLALVAGLLANRRDAWRTLLDDYGSGMRGAASLVVRRMARNLPSDFTRDIQQQVFVNLLQNDKLALRVFDPARGSLRTYLSRIAANLARDEMARFLRCGCPLDVEEVIASEATDANDFDGSEPFNIPVQVDFTFWIGARRSINEARREEGLS